ncbi:MAG: HEAT repeat domain-containing protein [Gemmatimonadales bacterium]
MVTPAEDDLMELFGELRPEALQAVLEWMPKLTNDAVRKPLDRAAKRLAASHPDQVIQTLETGDVPVVIMTLQMVAQLAIPPFVQALGTLLEREEPEVRKEAVSALAATGSPGAMRELEKAIDDAERDVRVIAVKALSEKGHQAAFSKIEAAVMGKGLRGADLTEKTVFYEAYGLMAGDDGVARLRPMLETKGLLRRKGDAETRACVAMALGKIGGEEAKGVLEQAAAEEKDVLVKNAINRALREIG